MAVFLARREPMAHILGQREFWSLPFRVTADTLDSAGVVTAYKSLSKVERDFRIIKADDLDLRPIRHYLADRVKAHILICMLAAYLTWHLRHSLAPLTYTDDPPTDRDNPVAPAQLSPAAARTAYVQAETEDALMEERRLAYVAFTRAARRPV